MSDYKVFKFTLQNPDNERDIFIALLSQAGFEGFVETPRGFSAYSNLSIQPDEVLKNLDIQYEVIMETVLEENWNKTWEQQIKPLVIDDKIYIKTSFHSQKDYPLTITIDPKMSFGTGHHETTFLMIKQLLEIDLKNKSIIDMGAGTGVLSILAKKLGAGNIYAVDIDKWAYENMLENFEQNQTVDIQSFKGSVEVLPDLSKVDIFLANINLNILMEGIGHYVKNIKLGGILILSGFYESDIPVLLKKAKKYGMVFESKKQKNNWSSIRLVKIKNTK